MNIEVPRQLAWPSARTVGLVVTDSAHYANAVPVLMAGLRAHANMGVYVTINRPAASVRATLQTSNFETAQVTIIDAVTPMTGILPSAEPGVIFIESPTQLEKIVMRSEQALRRLGDAPRFLVVDAASTLAAYNGPAAVAEFVHLMALRLRTMGVAGAFLAMEPQADAKFVGEMGHACDATMRV